MSSTLTANQHEGSSYQMSRSSPRWAQSQSPGKRRNNGNLNKQHLNNNNEMSSSCVQLRAVYPLEGDIDCEFGYYQPTRLFAFDSKNTINSKFPANKAVLFWDKLTHLAAKGHRNTYRVYLITTVLSGPPEDGNINTCLPKELLLRIFSFLDIISMCRCAQVCRDWNLLALDGSNWQRVNLFEFQKDIKGPVVENLAKRCGGFLKHLNLSGCENVQDGALHGFASKCFFIEELNLLKCKRLTDATCHSLGRHCRRLKVLNLDSCSAITEQGIRSISEGCPALEELNISWCSHILDSGLEALAANCPQLTKLICKGCEGISDDGIRLITQHCPNLRVLNVHSCSQLTDQTAQDLSDGCPLLEGLCMSMCMQITDRALQHLALTCHLLKDLELAGCSQLTDSGFNSLAKNCHELERMDLEDCSLITDHTLTQLATGCPMLEALSLSHCELITDEGIRQLALGLAMQDRLRFLDLDNCPLITDAALEYLRECRTLERVELYDCQLITRNGIRRFRQYLPEVQVHAYFAPATPEATPQMRRRGICRCCAVL